MRPLFNKNYSFPLTVILVSLSIFVLAYTARFDFNPSATIGLGGNYTVVTNDPGDNIVWHNNDGYDGSIYYFMARDITLQDSTVPGYFYKRILFSLTASLLSLGNKDIIPILLILINLAVIVIGSYFFMKILEKYSANRWLVLLFAVNVSFLLSLVLDIAEAMLYSLIIAAFYFYEKDNKMMAAVLLTLSLFAKEIAFLTIIPLVLFNFIRKRYKDAFLFMLPAIPYLAWIYFLSIKLGSSGIGLSIQRGLNLIPFKGFIDFLSATDFNLPLRLLVSRLSSVPMMIFAVIALTILIINYKEIKKLSDLKLYSLILLVHIFFVISMRDVSSSSDLAQRVTGLASGWSETLVGAGRFGAGLFIFSILSSAELNKKYNILLILLSILMIFMIAMAYIITPVNIGYTLT